MDLTELGTTVSVRKIFAYGDGGGLIFEMMMVVVVGKLISDSMVVGIMMI